MANLPISTNLNVLGLPPAQLALHLLEVDRKLKRTYAMGKGGDQHLSMDRRGFIGDCVNIQALDVDFNNTGTMLFKGGSQFEDAPESKVKPKAKSGAQVSSVLLYPDALVTLGLDQASIGAAETEHMSATGRVISLDDKLRRSINSITFLTRADNYSMQTLLWSFLSATFDMRFSTALDTFDERRPR